MVKFSAADELLGFVYQIVCTAATLKWSRAMQAVTILRNGFKVVMLFVCYGKPKKKSEGPIPDVIKDYSTSDEFTI